MVLVKIKSGTITKNQNAFNAVSFGHTTIDTTIKMIGLPPNQLKENEDYIITESSGTIGDPKSLVIEIRLIKNIPPSELRKMFKDIKDAEITVTYERHQIDHLPEPEYFYNYLNPKVKCSECKESVHVNDILDDDETGADKCPKCYVNYTFDYRYETINEALIRLKIK